LFGPRRNTAWPDRLRWWEAFRVDGRSANVSIMKRRKAIARGLKRLEPGYP
jgi:hypothetical protein